MAPDDPLLREQLAALDQLSGDLADAATNAQRAVDLLPSSSEDWSQLGVILAKQQKYEDAAADFRRAFQLDPEDVWALQNLAQSLKDLGGVMKRSVNTGTPWPSSRVLAWPGLVWARCLRKWDAKPKRKIVITRPC